MRHRGPVVLVALAALSLAAATAWAGPLDPKSLVPTVADVPAGFGFRVDRDKTGLATNEEVVGVDPSAKAKLRAWGRVTGYVIQFDAEGTSILSRADVLRSAAGSRKMLDYLDLQLRRGGFKGLVRRRAALGTGGWLYGGKDPGPGLFYVLWSDRTVFAMISALGLTRQQTLVLARAQQRRIAAALR